jgi:pimeloyl-ACP methyl ester carboxylesterase
MLLKKSREKIHNQVANAIEKLYSDKLEEFYETLCWHLSRGEAPGNAIDYFLLVIKRTRECYEYTKAIHLCLEAINIMAVHDIPHEKQVEIYEMLGDLYSYQENIEAANQAYKQAIKMAQKHGIKRHLQNKIHNTGVTLLNGAKVCYYIHGSTEPTILFVHPMAYGISITQPVMERLCQDYRFITFDPRGLGGSDPIPEIFTLREYAEDIRAVIETTCNEPIIFMGMSFSSRIGVYFATKYPHLVKKLILISSSFPRPIIYSHGICKEEIENYMEKRKIIQNDLSQGKLDEGLRIFLEEIYSEPGCQELIKWGLNKLRNYPMAVLKHFFGFNAMTTNQAYHPGDLLPEIAVKTLIMHGENDLIAPLECSKYLKEQIPDSILYILKGRCHMLLSTATDEVARVINDFVQQK